MMDRFTDVLKTEPTMVTSVCQGALAIAVTLGLSLTAGQTGALEAAAAGVAAIIVAASTRPVPVPILAGALTAIFTCLVAFGVHGVTPAVVSSVNAAIVAILAIVLRVHQTPVAVAAAPAVPARAVQ
jgi:hypothetical protein